MYQEKRAVVLVNTTDCYTLGLKERVFKVTVLPPTNRIIIDVVYVDIELLRCVAVNQSHDRSHEKLYLFASATKLMAFLREHYESIPSGELSAECKEK